MEVVKDSVAFLIPCAGDVDNRVLQSAMTLASFATFNGFTVRQVGITDRTVIHTARNILTRELLKSECEWAFWMDSDMILEPRTIATMISWLKKVDGKCATGVYYQRQGDHKPIIFLKDPKTVDGKRLHEMPDEYSHSAIVPHPNMKIPFKVDAAGFGCFLFHRSVAEAMQEPYFKNHFFKNDKEVSEDFYFCIKARQLGFDIWAIPDLRCGHIGTAQAYYSEDFKRPDEIAECVIETAKPVYGGEVEVDPRTIKQGSAA